MTSGELAALLSDLLNIPPSTVDLYGRKLRAAGLLSVKGHGRGAAQMTPMDAAAWLVALCIDHRRGGDFVAEVRQVLELPLCDTFAIPETFADGLGISKARNFGDAASALMSDSLASRFSKAMAKRQDVILLNFHAEGDCVGVSIRNKKLGFEFEAVSWTFQCGHVDDRKRLNLERVTAINGIVLYDIARAMKLIPPPPY